ncbi:MAG: NAD(P)-binding domain-containing protein, partial [Chloroflexota bacterium]
MATETKTTLVARLNAREALIGIVGLGYVGLPLAVEFAESGYTVIGYDVSEPKVERLNGGESYIPDIPTARMRPLVESGKLRATTDINDLADADAI